MFGGEDPRFEGGGRVARFDLYLAGPEDSARIQFFGDDMDGAASLGFARCEDPRMRVEPAIGGEQGWMDVDDPSPPLSDECRRQEPHISGQRDRADVMVDQGGADRLVEDFAGDALAVPTPGRNAGTA